MSNNVQMYYMDGIIFLYLIIRLNKSLKKFKYQLAFNEELKNN